jgi:hypothetical protein
MGTCSSSATEDVGDLSDITSSLGDKRSSGLMKHNSMSNTFSKLVRGDRPAVEQMAPIGIDVVVYEPLNVIIAKAIAKSSPPFGVDSIYAVGTSAEASNSKTGKKSIYYFIRVKVRNDNGKIRKFTIYRRYSQFEKLNKDLINGKKYPAVPKFPKKAIFSSTNNNIDSINLRKADLNKWLGLVSTRITDIMKDPVFQRFITENAVEIDYSDQISDLNQILCVFLPEGTESTAGPSSTKSAVIENGEDCDSGSEDSNELEAFIDVDFAMELIPQLDADTLEMLEEFSRQPVVGSSPVATNPSGFPDRDRNTPPPVQHRNINYDYDRVVSFGKYPDPKGKPGAVTIAYIINVRYSDELTGRSFQVMQFKRYSEFSALRDALVKAYSSFKVQVPALPKKNLFGERTNEDVDKMMDRRSKLNEWLKDVTNTLPDVKNNIAYCEFMTKNPNNIPDDFSVHMSLLTNVRRSIC